MIRAGKIIQCKVFILFALLSIALIINCNKLETRSGAKGGDGSGKTYTGEGQGTQANQKKQEATDLAEMLPGRTVYFAVMKKIIGAPVPDSISGAAVLIVEESDLILRVNAIGLSPGKHAMHIHARPDGGMSTCPGKSSDRNSDGFVDDPEADSVSGSIHVPLTDNPIDMTSESYPSTDEKGVLTYNKTISLSELQNILKSKYNFTGFFLDSCAIEIHGISASQQLPATVKSSEGKFANETLPVACGKIVLMK